MSKYTAGQKVKVLGVEATVQKTDPGAGQQDGLILVKMPDGTDRYVMESYLDTVNKAVKAKRVKLKEEKPAKEEKPPTKAKAPPKKKPAAKKTTKKATAKKSTKSS